MFVLAELVHCTSDSVSGVVVCVPGVWSSACLSSATLDSTGVHAVGNTCLLLPGHEQSLETQA